MYYSNLIMIVLFLGIGCWMAYNNVQANGKLEIYDNSFGLSKIIFVITGVLALATFFTSREVLDYVRNFCMLFCISMFLMQKDGIGPEGYATLGRYTKYDQISAYDYTEGAKRITVYFAQKNKKTGEIEVNASGVSFPIEKANEVKAYLKEHIGKKYRRMKKS